MRSSITIFGAVPNPRSGNARHHDRLDNLTIARAASICGAGVLAIDGKTPRRSFDHAAERAGLHVVTAFGAEAGVGIGQRAGGPGART